MSKGLFQIVFLKSIQFYGLIYLSIDKWLIFKILELGLRPLLFIDPWVNLNWAS